MIMDMVHDFDDQLTDMLYISRKHTPIFYIAPIGMWLLLSLLDQTVANSIAIWRILSKSKVISQLKSSLGGVGSSEGFQSKSCSLFDL